MSDARFSVTFGVGLSRPAPGDDPGSRPAGPHVTDLPAAAWPFTRAVTPPHAPASQSALVIRDLHRAFPAGQAAGTRLVLTQATYQLQRWLDWLRVHPGVTAFGDLRGAAPELVAEARARRGPWSRIDVRVGYAGLESERPARLGTLDALADSLADAFTQPDPRHRLAACQRATDADPTNPALHLAIASTCMELQQFQEAHTANARARALAPDWEAVHFELGKLWLRTDDTERAASAFAAAGRLMPSFAAAFSNLGAALAELDRGEEALVALAHALTFDPFGYPILNNIGAANRELGRLDLAEAAFRQTIALASTFVFAHYNLGHTLLLQGRFAESRDAYEDGLARDPQRNLRQRARLETARLAAGDGATALANLKQLVVELREGNDRGTLLELEQTLTALAALPGVGADRVGPALDWISAERHEGG